MPEGKVGDASDPYVSCNDFDGITHRQMLHMLDGVNQDQVVKVAGSLSDAGGSILDIANDLKSHMTNLEWESKAGDTFRDWGSKVASATFTLSDYASTAGTQMSNAGTVLGEVHKDMPPVPEGAVTTAAAYRQHKGVQGPFGDDAEGAHVPPGAPTPTTAEYHQALTEMQTAKTQAADNMTKLGGAYAAATEQMCTAQEPEFPPVPTQLMPPEPVMRDSGSYDDYGASGDSGGSRGYRPDAQQPVEEPEAGGGTDGAGGSSSGRLHVDGIGADRTGGGTLVAERPPPSGETHGPSRVAAFPPPPSGVTADPEPESPLPGGSRTGRTGAGSADEEGSHYGGEPVGAPDSRSAPRSALGDGIEGGELVDPPAEGAGAGRFRFSTGNVIGEEPGALSGLRGGARSGGADPFGPSAEEGTFAARGASALAEPEGAGAGMGCGMGGMPLSGAGRKNRDRRDGRRPDYLVEEDETWMPGGTGVVPSVFE